MSKISDELRQFTNTYYPNSSRSFKLNHIADRIDAEMVELPKDADGVPIHVGDTVYLDDGSKAVVTCIEIGRGSHGDAFKLLDESFSRLPNYLTHERLDSFERIADELDELVDGPGQADDICEMLAKFAERIRKLAKKEDKQ